MGMGVLSDLVKPKMAEYAAETRAFGSRRDLRETDYRALEVSMSAPGPESARHSGSIGHLPHHFINLDTHAHAR